MEEINMNTTPHFIIDKFPTGKTQNIRIKIGRKHYLVDIDKNALYTHLDFYENQKPKDRKSFSKYGAGLCYVTLKNNAVLDREFFKNITEIQRAQHIVNKYRTDLFFI